LDPLGARLQPALGPGFRREPSKVAVESFALYAVADRLRLVAAIVDYLRRPDSVVGNKPVDRGTDILVVYRDLGLAERIGADSPRTLGRTAQLSALVHQQHAAAGTSRDPRRRGPRRPRADDDNVVLLSVHPSSHFGCSPAGPGRCPSPTSGASTGANQKTSLPRIYAQSAR